MVGKLRRVPLRDVWKHEVLDFTRWLQDNLDVLSDALGLAFSNAERERSAGTFSVDLTAEDQDGDLVIIENQIEKSDHDHLGKLVTYLTAIEAKTAVWIVSQPRPEHVKAIAWLNESTSANFYLVKVEAVRVETVRSEMGDAAISEPAPLLTLIVGPSEDTREVREVKQELAQRHKDRMRFWADLLDFAGKRTKLHANISPSKDSWIAAGSGKSGISFNYSVRKHDAEVGLYIERPNALENMRIYNDFFTKKDQIEGEFGGELEWNFQDGRQRQFTRKRFAGGGLKDEESWKKIHEDLIDAMIRLECSLRPHLERVRI